MSSRSDRKSDEPTRLADQIVPLFSNLGGVRRYAIGSEQTVELLAGAPEQDDCAVYSFRGDQELVVGSDYIRGPKFRLYEFGLLDDFDLGYYLIAANVSDVSAMGAVPIGVLTVIRYPPDMDDDGFGRVLDGIQAACTEFRVQNVGGDIGGAERLILSGTALGVCAPGMSLRRSGAHSGDILCTTGPTGRAGAAMQYFRSAQKSAATEEYREQLISAWRRPAARVREGIALGQSGVVTSCQDTSDGLKAAIEGISMASQVGFEVYEDSIRIEAPVAAVCDYLKLDTMQIAFGDSVDFQLAFTVKPAMLPSLTDDLKKEGLSLLPIGVATDSGNPVEFVKADGRRTELPGNAWRHV